MTNREWFDIIKKDNSFLELFDKDTHSVYITPLTVIPILIIGFVVWYIQILKLTFKKIKAYYESNKDKVKARKKAYYKNKKK